MSTSRPTDETEPANEDLISVCLRWLADVVPDHAWLRRSRWTLTSQPYKGGQPDFYSSYAGEERSMAALPGPVSKPCRCEQNVAVSERVAGPVQERHHHRRHRRLLNEISLSLTRFGWIPSFTRTCSRTIVPAISPTRSGSPGARLLKTPISTRWTDRRVESANPAKAQTRGPGFRASNVWAQLDAHRMATRSLMWTQRGHHACNRQYLLLQCCCGPRGDARRGVGSAS